MLKSYTSAFGVSGAEDNIREVIKGFVKGFGDIKTDKLGNLIVHKVGSGKKVMIAAHMDEVGFIAQSIQENGRTKFKTVGGIDGRILLSKRVIFENGIPGVIGSKPIHLQSEEEREKPIPVRELFIDIGAKNRDEALKYVEEGSYAVFESEYHDLGDFIKAKALDDRVGCSILTEILKQNFNLDLYGAFTVQEEAGLRGAAACAYVIEPEVAIVLEGTTCADIAKDEMDFVTEPGMGPAISLMDRTSIANRRLLDRIVKTAKENNIPYQFRCGTVGGNDAGKIHRVKAGAVTATISVPTRYIHSPISMINKEDYKNTLKLVECVLKSIEREGL